MKLFLLILLILISAIAINMLGIRLANAQEKSTFTKIVEAHKRRAELQLQRDQVRLQCFRTCAYRHRMGIIPNNPVEKRRFMRYRARRLNQCRSNCGR